MTGVDIPINNLTNLFTNKLWISNTNDFNGRIYDNEREEGINPELYLSGIAYKEKLLNNKVDATIFFRVTDRDPVELLADVSIYFSVNLAKLYPTITTERADEYAIRDAKKWIDWSEFRIVDGGIISGKPAFDDYFGANQNKHDMQPFFLFRIDTTVNYEYGSCPVVAPTEFNLTLSSGTGGTATSNVGGEGDSPITVPSGDPVAAYALADTNYEFLNFLDNTNIVTQNPYPFIMKNNKDLVAQFISSLVQVQDVFGTDPIKNADNYYFEDQTNASNDYKILYYGNSITLTTDSCVGSVTESYPTKLTKLLLDSTGQNIEYINLGVSGYSGAEMDTNFDTDVLPYIDAAKTNILLYFEFVNQMDDGDTAQQAYDSIKSVGEKAKAAGMVAIVMTAPYAGTLPSVEDANDLLKADNSFADYFIDQNSVLDSVIMLDTDYSCDTVHLKDLGIERQCNYIDSEFVSQVILPIIESNNVKILNTPVLHLGGTDSYDTITTGTLGNNIDIRFIFSNPVYTANMALFTSGTNFRFYIDLATGYIKCRARLTGGSYENATFNNQIFNQFIWDLDVNINFDDNSVTINNQKHTFSTTFFAAITALSVGFAASYDLMEGDVHYFSVDDGTASGEYYFEETEGSTNYNSNGTMGSATITGADNSYGSSEFAEPGLIKKGYTRFVKDGEPIVFRRVIYLNGAPQLSTLTGFQKVADIEPFPCSNTDNTFDGIVYPALTGEKTYTEIAAEAETATFLKPGETANIIPQLIVKQ